MPAYRRGAALIWCLAAGAAAGAETGAFAPATRLTRVVDAYPSLSPDGSRLLFVSNRMGTYKIYTAKPDGSQVQRLTRSELEEGSPVWSPDGKRVAFAAHIGEAEEIFIVDADGGGLKQLTHENGSEEHPHFSRDGSRIFFDSARTTPDRKAPWERQWHEIFSMRADGSDVRQHSRCRALCTYGSVSPDGKKISYRKVVEGAGFAWDLTATGRNSEVFVADLDGSNELNLSRSAAYDGWPTWSPDGNWVLFSSNRTGRPLIGQLFAVRPDGRGVRQLTSGSESLVQPSWSPDGRRILAAQYSTDEELAGLVALEVSALNLK
jgi:TolB protein